MTGSWLEWAIMIFIVCSIGTVVWRNGAANPEGTGKLRKTVNDLSGNVSVLSQRVGHLEEEVAELKEETATTKDIQRVEQLIVERTAAQKDLIERQSRQIDRIERMLIEKGLGK